MEKNKIKFVLAGLLFFIANVFFAQLANWMPVPGGTNFPVNSSGQINGFSRISQMKFHATNNLKMYCVTAEGGLFLSNNQAASWTVAPGTESITNSCAAVCVDYTNDQIIYLGTGDANYYSNGAGILKSTNGGNSFSATGLTNCLVIEILQNPISSSEFVAATNKGIYKSTNAGVTWVAATATNIPFCDLKSNAAVNSQTLYAASNENVPKFLRSTDFGTSWTQVTTGIVASSTVIQSGARIGVTPSSTNVVYFSVIGDGGIIHKSNNNGLSFNVKKVGGSPFLTYYSNTVTSSSQGNYNHAICVDGSDPSKLWLQAHNTWLSVDSGATWTMLTFWANIVHTDMHHLQQAPYDFTKLYSSNDGGVWLSANGGNTWTTKSDGLYAYEIPGEAGIGSLIKKDFASIGTQDNGRVYSDQTGWYTIVGGDDYAKRQCDYNGNIYYDGTSRQLSHTGATGAYNLPTTNWFAFGFNKTNSNLGFMAYTDLYRTTNLNSSSPTWTALTANTTSIYAVHSCPSNANRLYYLVNGTFYGTNNALAANPTFTSSTFPNATTVRASIVSMANNGDIVYVMSNNAVYYSVNAGVSWTNVTYNLPNVNHRRILAEDYGGNQELVFVATNNAVYYKKVGQTTWTNYGTNLPSRRSPTGFSMFDNGTNQSRIRYASYGRAIWETAFDNIRAFSAQILFNDTTITCSSPTIQFNDGSLGAVNSPFTYTWNFPGGTPLTSNSSSANVTYSTTGNYIISLTIKDNLNAISTKTISKFIQVISCSADTIPDKALQVNNNGNYATTGAINLGNTNSITISAWIKIDVAQNSFAGIVFPSNNSNVTGLNFRNGNQIGYHYNGLASSYNYAGGPTISYSLWTHVALVTSANAATIFVNGVPYINTVANAVLSFNNPYNLGNDRNNTARTMIGQIDEVCFYNRALSQNEIREQMHLTKNHGVNDPSLKAYYQCNELGNFIYDRVGSANAQILGAAQHTISTAPVGSGTSERMTISSSGIKTFTAEGLNINFPNAVIPNGEICVTRLNIQPDSVPTNKSFTNSSAKYWIVNNYGVQSLSPLLGMDYTGYGNITTVQSSNPKKYKLYQRATGAYLSSSWLKVDSAATIISGTNAIVNFTGSSVSFFNSQFVIAKDSCFSASFSNTAQSLSLCANTSTVINALGNLKDNTAWKWFSGSCNGTLISTSNSIAITPSVAGVYYYRGEGGCAANGNCATVAVNIVSLPASPTLAISSTSLCEGATKIFSVINQSSASSYSWNLPNGWTGNSITNTIAVTSNSNNGVVSVKALNACGSSVSTSLSLNVVNTIYASQSLTLCDGQTINIGSNTYSSSGTYTNLFVRNNGCDSVLTTQLNYNMPLDTSILISGATLSSNASAVTYQWYDCDNLSTVPNATNSVFTPSNNGTFAVIIYSNNCSDTSFCYRITEVSLSKNYIYNGIKIIPNPASNFVTIKSALNNSELKLLNVLGQELMVCKLELTKDIDLSNFSNGVYFIQITNQNTKYNFKLIKQ